MSRPADKPSRHREMKIFRMAESVSLEEAGLMHTHDPGAIQLQGIADIIDAGIMDGWETRTLFCGSGFSLVYAWFRPGYPLPLHKHSHDCLYYIIAGSISMGSTELGAGDGFFLPDGTPYTYRPGPDGVELLEFRHTEQFDITYLAKNAKFWAKAVETVRERREAWLTDELPPSARPSPVRS